MNQKLAWLGLSKIEGIMHQQVENVLQKYHTPVAVFSLPKAELQCLGFTETQSKQFLQINEAQLMNETQKLQQKGIQFITIEEEEYPKQLKEIYDFPYWLYARGNLSLMQEKSVAMIGSRNCSLYGQTIAKKIAYQLVKQNIPIVSGMAKGIDAYSQTACIQAGGKTIAVLGSGIDTVYPKENEKLYQAILATGGVIVSEYPMQTLPLAQHFPARNRIISGLCEKMIVVEAGEKSGTFITVDFALEQGKEIYAVPGNITSPYSKRNESTN